MITGLKTFSSNCPASRRRRSPRRCPMTWTQTMVIASHCVGLTLPGMIEEPGSFSGSISSPRPQRGPEPSQRMSLAIFISDTASVLSAPLADDQSSWPARAANLFGAVTNGKPVSSAILAATPSANSGWVLRPVPTARAAEGQLVEAGKTASMPLEVGVELGDVAGKLLAQRQRHGVHQVRAADLDDVGERLGLGVQRVAQRLDRRAAGVAVSSSTAAMCMAVGKVSLDDCDMLTSSFGWTGFLLPISPPAISMARLAMTSLAFMLVCVPLPVCQMRSGKWSSSLPSMTSSAAVTMRSASCPSSLPRSRLARAALLEDAERADQRGGILSPPMAKWWSDRAVWPPSNGRRGPRSRPWCRSRYGSCSLVLPFVPGQHGARPEWSASSLGRRFGARWDR